MRLLPPLRCHLLLLTLAICCLVMLGCGDRAPDLSKPNADTQALAGTWLLEARITEDGEAPATDRVMRLALSPRGTFQAYYRGDTTQQWVRAGEGGYSYSQPVLTLYWDNGATVTLLVSQLGPDRIRVHHGLNLVPLKDQDPDEIFVRQKMDKGPTQGAS
ncbi:MAG: hypothetical protein AB1733_04820 [Thermodesulfobacteriota bacterium]